MELESILSMIGAVAGGVTNKLSKDELNLFVELLDEKMMTIAKSILDLKLAKEQSEESSSIQARDLETESRNAMLTILSLKTLRHSAFQTAIKRDESAKESGFKDALLNSQITKSKGTLEEIIAIGEKIFDTNSDATSGFLTEPPINATALTGQEALDYIRDLGKK